MAEARIASLCADTGRHSHSIVPHGSAGRTALQPCASARRSQDIGIRASGALLCIDFRAAFIARRDVHARGDQFRKPPTWRLAKFSAPLAASSFKRRSEALGIVALV